MTAAGLPGLPLLALALSLGGVPAARAASASDDDGAAIRRAAQALADEDVEDARRLVEPLLARAPGDPVARLLAGVLRFHEQRYAEAAELLEDSEGRQGGIDYRSLARAARDLTRDHQRAESAHFRVSYPPGKEEVLVPYLLETLEAQRTALEHDIGWVPPGRVTVEILRDTRELARLSTLTDAEIRTSGTIALCKFDKLMVVSPKALLSGYDWLDTAAHEYTHQVVTQRTHNSTPIWLHEGLAKYSETRWRGRGGESLSPFSAALLQEAARKDKLITFAEMHPSMAKLPSQEAASLAFAEVMVAVEYLTARGGQPLLAGVLDRIRGGSGAERAVADALGVSFEEFLAGWKRFLASRPMPVGGDTELRRLRFRDDPGRGGGHGEWAEISDEKARSFARLGEILRERGRWAAARVEYGKAMQRVGPRYPVLVNKFALAALRTGREQEAEALLSQAARAHPGYPALQVTLGRVRVKRKEWPAARQAFLLANRIDPFDPEIHAGLAATARAEGDEATAAREERFTRMLTGESPERGHGHPN